MLAAAQQQGQVVVFVRVKRQRSDGLYIIHPYKTGWTSTRPDFSTFAEVQAYAFIDPSSATISVISGLEARGRGMVSASGHVSCLTPEQVQFGNLSSDPQQAAQQLQRRLMSAEEQLQRFQLCRAMGRVLPRLLSTATHAAGTVSPWGAGVFTGGQPCSWQAAASCTEAPISAARMPQPPRSPTCSQPQHARLGCCAQEVLQASAAACRAAARCWS